MISTVCTQTIPRRDVDAEDVRSAGEKAGESGREGRADKLVAIAPRRAVARMNGMGSGSADGRVIQRCRVRQGRATRALGGAVLRVPPLQL